MNVEEAIEYILEKSKPVQSIEDIGLSFRYKDAVVTPSGTKYIYEGRDRSLTLRISRFIEYKIKQYVKLRKMVYDGITVDYEELEKQKMPKNKLQPKIR